MKKLLILACMLWSVGANAQFTPGQVLTAAELNTQFALYAPLAGATFTGGVSGTIFSGTFSGSLNGSVGSVTPSTGSFTNLTATGTVTIPAIALSGLATQAANTVVANATGSSASPTAIAIPSCSTSSSALQWTSGTGLACNSAINASTLGSATFASPGPIGSSTASTGAFTNLSSSGTVSGAGFSSYLASPPAIGGTTAASGKFTTLQATSTITPSTTSGIVGTTLADNANAGSYGEYVTATTASTAATSGVTLNATSINLTAGDWDVMGIVATIPAGTTTTSNVTVGISTTSATFGNAATGIFNVGQIIGVNIAAGVAATLPAPVTRINVSTTTTVYLATQVAFGTSTMSVAGYIRARRVR